LEIELSDIEVANVTLQWDHLREAVLIVIGGDSNVLEVRIMHLFMSPCRIQLQGYVTTNLCDPIRIHIDYRKVEISIQHLGNLYHVADIILLGVHFALLL